MKKIGFYFLAFILISQIAGQTFKFSSREIELAWNLFQSQNYDEAIDVLIPLVYSNNLDAIYHLGFLYQNARDYHQNLSKAASLYKKGAELGDERCQFVLGQMYYSGSGVIQSNEEAIKWLLLTAEKGNTNAKSVLGNVYESIEDFDNAFKWHLSAAIDGDEMSQFKVTLFFMIRDEFEEAYYWSILTKINIETFKYIPGYSEYCDTILKFIDIFESSVDKKIVNEIRNKAIQYKPKNRY